MTITDAGLAHLEKLGELHELTLASKKITDAGMTHLTRLPRLRGLHLEGTSITAAGLISLPRLEKLSLKIMPITRDCLVRIREMRGLEELSISFAHSNEVGYADLAALASLTRLRA